MHEAVFAGRPGLLSVGEMPGVTVDQARAHTDPKRAELDMVFEFEHVAIDHGPSGRFDLQPLNLMALKATLGHWQAGLAEVGWNSLYWCNHDQPRVVSRFGDVDEHRARSAKLLATVLHMHRGTPYIYQGEEIGMANYPFTSPDELRDIESLRELARRVTAGDDPQCALAAIRPGVRDNARTPMQWDASIHAGFTSGTPWMPLNPDHHTVNVAAQAKDPESVLAHYRRLIALRRELPVIVDGTFTMFAAAHPHVYAFTRQDSTSELLVLSNWSSAEVGFEVPNGDLWRNAELLISNTTSPPRPGARVRLAPWEAVVYKRPTT
jgi:oligo-1,6-glucosidase